MIIPHFNNTRFSYEDCLLDDLHTCFWIQLQASLESLDQHTRSCNLYAASLEPESRKTHM